MVSQSDIFPDLEQVRLVGHSQARKTHTTDKGPLVCCGISSLERVLLRGSAWPKNLVPMYQKHESWNYRCALPPWTVVFSCP